MLQSIYLKGEELMFTVTPEAQQQIARYFEDNEIKSIRVFLSSCCGGPQVALALDNAKPNDRTFEVAGIQYLVDNAFLVQAQPIEIDFAGRGFKISSALELSGDCSGCGSSTTCCE